MDSGAAGEPLETTPSPPNNVPPSNAAPLRNGLIRRACAEAVGTFALVFAGCGAIVVDARLGELRGAGITHVGVSLVFGLVIAVMVYATGHISGAHFNPAVTIGFAAMKRFKLREVPVYIVAQVVAALCAASLLRFAFGTTANLGATAPQTELAVCFLVEAVLTFFLMFVIAAVATDARASSDLAGVAIGGTVMLAALFGGPVTGGSLNPARSLGPALAIAAMPSETMVSGTMASGTVASIALNSLWLYLTAPVVGAVVGALAYRVISEVDRVKPPSWTA